MKNKFNNNNATFCKITALLSSVMLDKTTLILPAEFKVNFVVVRGGGGGSGDVGVSQAFSISISL